METIGISEINYKLEMIRINPYGIEYTRFNKVNYMTTKLYITFLKVIRSFFPKSHGIGLSMEFEII